MQRTVYSADALDWIKSAEISSDSLLVAKFIAQQIKSRTIINPFCGHGSMLAAANAVGCDAIGIEKSPKRAKKAGFLQLDLATHRWVTDFKGQQS